MSYIIWPDLKSVATFDIAKGGITIEGHGFMPDSEVDDLNHRLFSIHPDVNPLCSRDEEGYVLYKGQRLADPWDAYRDYLQQNKHRAKEGWEPVCMEEFKESEWLKNYYNN